MIKDKKIINVNFKNKSNRLKSHKNISHRIHKDGKLTISIILHKIGTFFLKKGKYNLSNRILNLAKSYKPKLTNYLIGLSYYYAAKNNEKKGDNSRAEELFKQAICYYNICLKYNSNTPSDFHVLLEIANIYLELDDIYAFSKVYQKMILLRSGKITGKVCKFKGKQLD